MNCPDCRERISTYLDNELEEASAAEVRDHLALCSGCARVCEDLSSILDVCASETSAELLPPNSQAMWCRINNIIEAEKPVVPPAAPPTAKRGWHFSVLQISAALVCIAVLSSVVTVVAIQSYVVPSGEDMVTRSAASQTTFEKAMTRLGLMESPQETRDRRIKEQQSAIDYWNARVQSRRVQWDKTTREAFDRNLRVIDETVHEYSTILQRNPDDEISGEMLDSVLHDKMKLLRDFAQL